MIKLYCFPRSGNSREVKLTLAEKQIPYESINVHADEKIKQDPDFQKASPSGKVPAIVDGETYMAEAYDINEYLEKSYPDHPVLPSDDNEKQSIRDWVMQMDKKLCLKIGLLLIETILKPKDQQKEEIKEKLRNEIYDGLRTMENQLGDKEYLFSSYSLADISMTPHLAALARLNVPLGDEFSRVKDWMERVKSRPNFEASAN